MYLNKYIVNCINNKIHQIAMKKLFLLLIFFIFSFNEIFAKSKLDTVVAERIEAVSTININYDEINSQLSEL